MWAIFRLIFLTCRSVLQDVWGIWVGGRRDLVISIVGTMTLSCYKWFFSSLFMYTMFSVIFALTLTDIE